MKRPLASLFLLAVLMFWPLKLWAVGVSVRPSSLELRSVAGQTGSAELLVSNQTGEMGLYQIKADELADAIKIEPSDFQLDALESRLVKISLSYDRPFKKELLISVISRPPGANQLLAATGVKVPLKIFITGFAWYWKILGIFCLLFVCALAGLGLKLINDKKNKNA